VDASETSRARASVNQREVRPRDEGLAGRALQALLAQAAGEAPRCLDQAAELGGGHGAGELTAKTASLPSTSS
jgi:hypothetical protein